MIQCKTSKEIGGMGHSIKRKEDARFIQGKGQYIDDIKLPGMIYMDIVRSPYAYAKILNINPEKALALPGVLAVVTGKDLLQGSLHHAFLQLHIRWPLQYYYNRCTGIGFRKYPT